MNLKKICKLKKRGLERPFTRERAKILLQQEEGSCCSCSYSSSETKEEAFVLQHQGQGRRKVTLLCRERRGVLERESETTEGRSQRDSPLLRAKELGGGGGRGGGGGDHMVADESKGDREAVNNFLISCEAKALEHVEKMKAKYNFDFKKGQPRSEGQWTWARTSTYL